MKASIKNNKIQIAILKFVKTKLLTFGLMYKVKVSDPVLYLICFCIFTLLPVMWRMSAHNYIKR